MTAIILASDLTGTFPVILSVTLEHTKGMRLLYVPTAAYGEGWEPDYITQVQPFEQAGFAVEMFDLDGKSRIDTIAALERSDVVFVSGGNTFHLLHHMKKSGFFDEVGKRIADGLVYAGSSAGSVVAAPDISYASSVDDPSKGGNLGTSGLGLVDRRILPHMDHPAFAPLVSILAASFEADGIPYYGLNDQEAIVIDDNGLRLMSANMMKSTPLAH